MRYTHENILNSELAYRILQGLQKKEEGSYGSELAEELDADRTNISEIISNLQEMDLVEKGKRTKAQYYEVSYQGLKDTFFSIWKGKGSETSSKPGNLEAISSSDKTSEFIQSYCKLYFETVESSTINQMLVDDFYEELNFVVHSEDVDLEIPDQIQMLHSVLMGRYKDHKLFGRHIKYALYNLSENEEKAQEVMKQLKKELD